METSSSKPAPVSIFSEGDGAVAISCADTSLADNNIAKTAATTNKKALVIMLTCAIDGDNKKDKRQISKIWKRTRNIRVIVVERKVYVYVYIYRRLLGAHTRL